MFGPLLSSHLREGRRSRRSSSGEDEGEDEDDEDEDEDQTAAAEQQRSSKPAHRGRHEDTNTQEILSPLFACLLEHERGFRRDTTHKRNFSSLLMFCFFALCFVCPLPVLLIWTPRPVANVHTGTYKSLTYTPHNLCQICTEYVSLV